MTQNSKILSLNCADNRHYFENQGNLLVVTLLLLGSISLLPQKNIYVYKLLNAKHSFSFVLLHATVKSPAPLYPSFFFFFWLLKYTLQFHNHEFKEYSKLENLILFLAWSILNIGKLFLILLFPFSYKIWTFLFLQINHLYFISCSWKWFVIELMMMIYSRPCPKS